MYWECWVSVEKSWMKFESFSETASREKVKWFEVRSYKTPGRCALSANEIQGVGQCCSPPPSPDMIGSGTFGGDSYSYTLECVGVLSWLCWVPRAAITTYHKLCVLPEKFALTAPEARSRKSKRPQGHTPITSLILVTSGGSWHTLACNRITPASTAAVMWPSSLCVFLCVSIWITLFFLLQRHQLLDLGPTLIQYDHFLTNSICKDSISKEGHILRLRWTWIWGEPFSTRSIDQPHALTPSMARLQGAWLVRRGFCHAQGRERGENGRKQEEANPGNNRNPLKFIGSL